jgi:carbonic anhydrase
MHTVHFPDPNNKENTKEGFIAAAMGLFFSVKDYTKTVTPAQEAIVDEFFDSLQWTVTDKNPKVDEVTYGKLMMMADMNNRWTYTGSVTTPPCAQNVYWNVLRTVYPIKKRHLDQFIN